MCKSWLCLEPCLSFPATGAQDFLAGGIAAGEVLSRPQCQLPKRVFGGAIGVGINCFLPVDNKLSLLIFRSGLMIFLEDRISK